MIKFYFDGVGTAAGVAWPVFGILTAVLGVSAGGVVAIALGAVCSIAFLIIGIAVFYLSYKKNAEAVKTEHEKLISYIMSTVKIYHQLYLKNNSDLDFFQYLSQSQNIENDRNNNIRLMVIKVFKLNPSFLQSVENKNSTINNSHDLIISSKQLIEGSDVQLIPVSFKDVSGVVFLSFVGTFGSIAGCSAGLMGLFSGLGLIAGFGSIPALGGCILIIACLISAYISFESVQTSVKNNQKKQVFKLFKQFKEENQNSSEQNISIKTLQSVSANISFFSHQGNDLSNDVKLFI